MKEGLCWLKNETKKNFEKLTTHLDSPPSIILGETFSKNLSLLFMGLVYTEFGLARTNEQASWIKHCPRYFERCITLSFRKGNKLLLTIMKCEGLCLLSLSNYLKKCFLWLRFFLNRQYLVNIDGFKWLLVFVSNKSDE